MQSIYIYPRKSLKLELAGNQQPSKMILQHVSLSIPFNARGKFSQSTAHRQPEGSAAVSPGCILCLVPADHPPRRCRAEADHLDPGTCASEKKGLTGMVN